MAVTAALPMLMSVRVGLMRANNGRPLSAGDGDRRDRSIPPDGVSRYQSKAAVFESVPSGNARKRLIMKRWPGAELNRRYADFQPALSFGWRGKMEEFGG